MNPENNLNLNGEWEFAYVPPARVAGVRDAYTAVPGGSADAAAAPVAPSEAEFESCMPAPAFWDDHLDRVRQLSVWPHAAFNPLCRPIAFPVGRVTSCASLPYLLGTGWYRKSVDVPANWRDRTVTLRVGGVVMEAWIWCNGQFAGHHSGHSTAFELPLENFLRPGAANQLLIAVANTREDREGCSIRGYAGRSGGIYRSISLRAGGARGMVSLFLHPALDLSKITWQLDTRVAAGAVAGTDWQVEWFVRDPVTGAELRRERAPGQGDQVVWDTDACGMRPWSDDAPVLYEVGVRLYCAGVLCDERVQPFGLRRLTRAGMQLRLNGNPVFLRGATEHHYFPLTCTAPASVGFYRWNLRRLKALGFNWLRFHTWAPNEEYMHAADEVGMLIQVEPPYGSCDAEWVDILRACRTHPSVVLFCGGNEELLDESKIVALRRWHALCREYAPDALFSPMEALRGVDYGYKPEQLEPGAAPLEYNEPGKSVRYNTARLAHLREFSDVFETSPGLVPYAAVPGDWQTLGRNLPKYGRPILLHELCIHGSYLDLDLEHRYAGTRIGLGLYAAARAHLRAEGVLHKAALYYRNSCEILRRMRKNTVETARRCRHVQGYDLLGATDHHWHRTGYPCGIMNEFYELKPGESAANVRRYNGETVLLLDVTDQRNYVSGAGMNLELLVSHYGRYDIENDRIAWHLGDDAGHVYARGVSPPASVARGALASAGDIACNLPQMDIARKITLRARLATARQDVENQWDFWVFPELPAPDISIPADAAAMKMLGGILPGVRLMDGIGSAPVCVLTGFDQGVADYVARGGRVLLLWRPSNPEVRHRLLTMSAGRPLGDHGTVIYDHPIMRDFPHEGFCDWQFYQMLDDANPVIFDDPATPFDPIVEVISSYKRVRKQALLFEYRLGQGAVLVCGLQFNRADPAARFVAERMLHYMAGPDFTPRHSVSPAAFRRLLGDPGAQADLFTSDHQLDLNTLQAARETKKGKR